MKEQPLFAPGQFVRCIDSGSAGYNHLNMKVTERPNILVEGKRYEIEDPCAEDADDGIYVKLVGVIPVAWQGLFVPDDFDRYADEVLHESFKGKPVVKHELN